MATVADIRLSGSQITTVSYPVAEPLNAPINFTKRLKRFGSNYNTTNESHLYRYLVALCGDAGAGQLKKEMLLPRLQQMLEATDFLNLDRLYGTPLGLPRISTEAYDYTPNIDFLTRVQWDEIRAKDASYRARCLTWMRAIIAGPTAEGMALAAEAALGVEADVWERYKYVQNPSYSSDYGKTGSLNEFVIIPRVATITPADNRKITRLIDQLRPTNTVGTVYTGTSNLRVLRNARASGSSSDRFSVQRLVTGRPDIEWPAIDPSVGYWIDNTEREAPTLAYMDRQESVTYLTITSAEASSIHSGFFNKEQTELFSHLKNVRDATQTFSADQAFATNIAPINLAISWTGGGSAGSNIAVNNSYPLTYFADTNPGSIVSPPMQDFWASNESYAPDEEWIVFHFGRTRPVNFLDFQVSQKPFNWKIEYYDGDWKEVTIRDDNSVTMSSTYLPSEQNPWQYVEASFDLIQTEQIRITFTRQSMPFPLETTPPFPFSVEVRGARLMHVIAVAEDFVADSGTDILGNSFNTNLVVYSPDDTLTTDPTTFWQSQPNPSRFAVESLYYDLRQGQVTGTMSYLDTVFIDELDTRSMADMANYYEDGQIVDEIYLDPITTGPDMHFYYSDDDTPNWDNKLWIPVGRDYILKRGFHALPRPIKIRYFKIEFSNLVAIPYEPVLYPSIPNVYYRQFPTWVFDYFNNIHREIVPDEIRNVTTVTIDPLTFGFVKVDDRMVSNYEFERTTQTEDTSTEVADYIQNVLTQSVVSTQADIEKQIEFKSPIMWQSDLIANLDSTRALSRVAQQIRDGVADTGFNAELTLPALSVPVEASSQDLSVAIEEKTRPTMWFPQKCRHTYKLLKAPLDSKIAYFAAVKNVGFYRRTYIAPVDDVVYVDTLGDEANISVNQFVLQPDGRYGVGI